MTKGTQLVTGQNTGDLICDHAISTKVHTYLQDAFKYSCESFHIVQPTQAHLQSTNQISELFLSISDAAYSFGWLPSCSFGRTFSER